MEGVAAGDVIRIRDQTLGTFDVLHRSGLLAVKILSRDPLGGAADWVQERLRPLQGRLDGRIEEAAVFSVPVSAGFPTIEAVLEEAVRRFPHVGWYYGNVHELVDHLIRPIPGSP